MSFYFKIKFGRVFLFRAEVSCGLLRQEDTFHQKIAPQRQKNSTEFDFKIEKLQQNKLKMDTMLARQLPNNIILRIIRETSDAKSEHKKKFQDVVDVLNDAEEILVGGEFDEWAYAYFWEEEAWKYGGMNVRTISGWNDETDKPILKPIEEEIWGDYF